MSTWFWRETEVGPEVPLTNAIEGGKGVAEERGDTEAAGEYFGIPTELSCRSAFDELFRCYSLPSQAFQFYRYGERKQCADRLNEFRFCLSARGMESDARRKAIQEELKSREQANNGSERIWKRRTHPLHHPFAARGTEDSIEGFVSMKLEPYSPSL